MLLLTLYSLIIYNNIITLNNTDIIIYLNIDSIFKYDVFSFKYIINIKDNVCISISNQIDVMLLVSTSHKLEINKHKNNVSLFIFQITKIEVIIRKTNINVLFSDLVSIMNMIKYFINLFFSSFSNIRLNMDNNIIIFFFNNLEL